MLLLLLLLLVAPCAAVSLESPWLALLCALASLSYAASRLPACQFAPIPSSSCDGDAPPPQPSPAPQPSVGTPLQRVATVLETLYASDRPFEAVKELERVVAASELQLQDPTVVDAVRQAQGEIFELTAALDHDAVWVKDFVHKGCQIYRSKSSPRDFKVTCLAPDVALFDLVALIYETDLYKHWIPGCSSSSRWRLSVFRQVLHLRFKVPIAFVKDRDVLLKGYGDVWNGDAVMIYVKSVDRSSSLEQQAEAAMNPQQGAVRVQIDYGGILLRPKPLGGVELTMMSRIDLGLALVPNSVFDHVAKYVLAEIVYFMVERASPANVCSDRHAMWRARSQVEDTGVYDEARRRLAAMGQQS
jgi:hypothetical protein